MSLFRGLFGQKAGKGDAPKGALAPAKPPSFYFPPPDAAAPPVPQGEWKIIVDANGDRVQNRTPAPTDFLARHPVEYIYGGTFPKVKHTPTYDDRNIRGEDHREHLDYLIRDKRNREFLDKAVFLLSQTDDGRRLLEKSQKMEFQIIFDDALCMEEGAVGLCDYTNKKIPLAQGRSPAEVALTLKHELQHMEDMDNGLGYSSADIPKNGIFGNRALESNARVSEAVAAAEILLGSPNGPQQQFRSAALLNNFWRKNQEMAKAAYGALDDAKAGKWESFASKVFPAYFKPTHTLEYYDKKYADYIAAAVPDHPLVYGPIQSRREEFEQAGRYAEIEKAVRGIFRDDTRTPDITISKLTIRGKSYDHALMESGLSLTAEKNYAQTAVGLPMLGDLKKRINNAIPDNTKTAWLNLPAIEETITPPQPAPYASFTTRNEEQPFRAVQPPYKIVNDPTGIGWDNEFYTKSFIKEYESISKTHGEVEATELSLYKFEHKHDPQAKHYIFKMVQAGLRIPITGLPHQAMATITEHIFHSSQPRPEILELIAHWQEMKDRGMDPVFNDHEKRAEWNGKENDMRELPLTNFPWAFLLERVLKPTPVPQGLDAQLKSTPTQIRAGQNPTTQAGAQRLDSI